jgi:hypothetical protein
MCKHVAAVLYGIGARLDEDPNLFFTLRKADVTGLISKAVADQTDSLLKKAKKKSARVMDSADLSDVFGIDLADPAENDDHAVMPKRSAGGKTRGKASTGGSEPPHVITAGKSGTAPPVRKKPAERKKSVQGTTKTPPVGPRKNASSKKPQAGTAKTAGPPPPVSAVDRTLALIRKSKSGIGIPELIEKTGFDPRKIYNIVFRLKKMGKIRSVSHGIYIGVP